MDNADKRERILKLTADAVLQDRNAEYGDPEDNFRLIADFWGVYTGRSFTEQDVAIMMILTKIARAKVSPSVLDHWVDMAGYGVTGGQFADHGEPVWSNEAKDCGEGGTTCLYSFENGDSPPPTTERADGSLCCAFCPEAKL